MTVKVSPVAGSSFIAGVGYDPSTQTMAIQFKDGSTFEATGVDEGDYHAFNGAASMGRYWHGQLKDQYSWRRV